MNENYKQEKLRNSSFYYEYIASTRRSAQFVLDCINMKILRTEAYE